MRNMQRTDLLWVLASALIATATMSACGARGELPAGPTTSSESDLYDATDILATDLRAPWSVTFAADTALISERDSARILELDSDGSTREVGAIDDVAPAGEGGLLGIAVHEDYLYAYATGAEGNRIDRFELIGSAGSYLLGEAETLIDGLPAAAIHNGGRIAFGPDGMLYATAGDAGDPRNGQDVSIMAGKILRLTPNGDVPEDNPFPGSPVYSYGHRNPQGLAWDDQGTLYASEFGQDTWDELNVIEPGGNYGWPIVEGIAEQDEFIDPVQQWSPAEASPSGITITDGSIYVANLRGERLREVPLSDLTSSREHLVGEYGRLRDIALAPDGSLWVVTNNTDGRGDPGSDDDRIIRIQP